MRLRTQITVLGVGTALLVTVLAALPLAFLIHDHAWDEAQQRATYAAQSTADYMTAASYDQAHLASYVERLNRRAETPVTVLEPGGRSAGARLVGERLRDALRTTRPALGDGDEDNLGTVSRPRVTSTDGARLVQIFCQTRDGEARIVAVLEGTTVRSRIRAELATMVGVALLLVALAWVAAELVGARIVRPLRRTAATASALSSGDLTARAPESGPIEVAQVARELNALATRIGELLTMERENAADLSHRLRTPLTAVRLAVEALPPGPGRSDLEHHVAAVERSLTQTIRAARRGDREGLHPSCDAAAVARDRASFWRPLVEDQGRSWEVTLPEGEVRVRLAAEDLGDALDALLENAVAHTPEGTPLAVRVRGDASAGVVEVLDQGTGVPASALVRGRSDRGSSGLGLDIARRTAEASGGALELVTTPPWHGVRLLLGHAPD
ncbi:sensor histidine kinase [Nocardioides jiangxiensis]|uniref:Signal transduction histidine-protein kinase/phosphatase MprB n=1 Tax=Nocardioides jiangxiensis TaxID=3064524 RepID=A0ABT9AYM2_9ACTN|nr:HAMP domain-containing sensor histidine kinase [Nocardioides sp. WY-20]MDO7867074.1 HAMP domain-containing sensor histidine kinase [Nocardioides sp. WY-20]